MYEVEHLVRIHRKSMDMLEKERQLATRRRKVEQQKYDKALDKALRDVGKLPR